MQQYCIYLFQCIYYGNGKWMDEWKEVERRMRNYDGNSNDGVRRAIVCSLWQWKRKEMERLMRSVQEEEHGENS